MLLKPLKILIFWPNLWKNGSPWATTQNRKKKFFSERFSSWMSYEYFSNSCDAFLLKSVISSHSSSGRDTWKIIQILQLFEMKWNFHIKWNFTLVSGAYMGWAIPVSQIIWYWRNLGKLMAPNTPNHMQGHMKSNPKISDPYLTWNETLL